MKTKADRWGQQLRQGILDRRTAWQGLTTMIWPSLKFPLTSCSFTWKQGDATVARLYKALLPKLGANRNFPKLWRHAPSSLLGLNLPHPKVEQSVAQLNLLISSGTQDSITNNMTKANAEAIQLWLG